VAASAAAAAAALIATMTGGTSRPSHPARRIATRHVRARRGRSTRRRVVLGLSVRGRAIRAQELGDPRLPTSLLVVGCVHGNEPAGIAVARLIEAHPPPRAHVWVIEDLNPDGRAAGTRVNAQGIDLNRNFPWRWRPLARATGQYSGPAPLFAPEARIAHDLILRTRPRVAVWLHQPLGVVDLSGGNPTIERRFAHLAGMRVERLQRYPGSAVGWQDHDLPRTTAFVVELPGGALGPARAARLAGALRAMAQ
jgi:protein MpaA